MNNYLNYYYGLYPLELHQSVDFFYFELNSKLYYFIIYKRPITESKALYELTVSLILKQLAVHQIILNKDYSPLTYINNIPYLLLKTNINTFSKVTLNDILYLAFNSEVNGDFKSLIKTDWPTLWAEKIDYFEYQISQVAKKHPLLGGCLNYFIGLGENAITYIKNTVLELQPTIDDSLVLAHKRIKANDTLFDLYNPLNFIIDYKVRDIAEYVKSSFWANKDIRQEVDWYFKTQNLSPYSIRLFYGRLLYPSYFFDLYEQIIDGYLEDEVVLKIIERIKEYEALLSWFHQYLATYQPLPSLSWLTKR